MHAHTQKRKTYKMLSSTLSHTTHACVRKTLQFAGCSLTWWRKFKTGQVGGMPYSVCCNAPDLRIDKSVSNNSVDR